MYGIYLEWFTSCGPDNPTMVVYEQKVQEAVASQSTGLAVSAGLHYTLDPK